MRGLARWSLVAGITLLAGCGAMDGADDDDNQTDAGVGDGTVCEVAITWSPDEPVAGDTVTVTAIVPQATGLLSYEWTVSHDGSVVATTPVSVDGGRVAFAATAAGPYYVDVFVTGTDCFPGRAAVNVRAPGATDTLWRLRFTAPDAAAPPQERTIVVPSGADYDYGEVALDPGAAITGNVVDADGVGVPAYLRLTPTGTPDVVIDGFAAGDGAFSILTTLARHDLLIIPFRADLAPRVVRDWTPTSGDLTVDGGAAVTGTAVDPAGQPLAGATVTLRVAGVPSTIATTDAAGAFTVRARPVAGATTEVVVVPPDGSGLPRLASAPATLDLTAPLQIRYGASLVRRDVGGAAVTLGGASAAGAAVTFTGAVSAAGLVTDGASQATAAGSFAIEVPADAGGALAAALVPAVDAVAVVTPAAGAAGVVAVDLTAGAPGTIAAPAPVVASGRVVGPTGAPVAAADVRAIPAGALAAAGAAHGHVAADDDGTFTLPLAGGGAYDLVILDRAGGLALLRTTVAAAGAAALGDLALPDGLELRGAVSLDGQPVTAGAVTVFCESCDADARARPAAEAAVDTAGRFRAAIVDPGVP